MHKAYKKLFKQTADIYRKQISVKDAAGESQAEYAATPTYTAVPCLFNQLSGNQVISYQGLGIQARNDLFVDYSVDIKIGDKVVVEGVIYYVVYKDNMVGNRWQHHINCALNTEVNQNASL